MMVILSHSLPLTPFPSASFSSSSSLPSSSPLSSLLPPFLPSFLSRCALPLVTKEVLFLNFYADWCRFSQQLKPIFDKAASTLQAEFPVGHVTNPLPWYHVVMVTSQIHYHGNWPTCTMLSLILLPWYHEPKYRSQSFRIVWCWERLIVTEKVSATCSR